MQTVGETQIAGDLIVLFAATAIAIAQELVIRLNLDGRISNPAQHTEFVREKILRLQILVELACRVGLIPIRSGAGTKKALARLLQLADRQASIQKQGFPKQAGLMTKAQVGAAVLVFQIDHRRAGQHLANFPVAVIRAESDIGAGAELVLQHNASLALLHCFIGVVGHRVGASLPAVAGQLGSGQASRVLRQWNVHIIHHPTQPGVAA